MRFIQMLTNLAGPDGCVDAGKVIACEDKRAKILVDSFSAEYVTKDQVEKKDFQRDVVLKDIEPVKEKPKPPVDPPKPPVG